MIKILRKFNYHNCSFSILMPAVHGMRKSCVYILLLLSTTCAPILSQIVLDKEEYRAGRYVLTFRNHGYANSIRQEHGRPTIRFQVPGDVGREGAPILPRKDLFIALPAENRSTLRFVRTQQEVIPSVTPALNPRVHQENDSLITYSEFVGASPAGFANTAHYTFNGYVWIGDNYCAHVTIFPYLYDEQQRQIDVLKEFQIDLAVPSGPADALMSLAPKTDDELIVNSRSAAGWKSTQPVARAVGTDSWIDYSQEYLKIGVVSDDVYRLSYADLLTSGIPVGSINPKALKLYVRGKEVPVYVHGENDQAFNPGDYLEFLGRRNYGSARYREPAEYGKPYNEYLDRYSDTTIYWLGWTGGNGRRVDTILSISGVPNDTTKYYDELVHKEIDNYWDFSLTGGDVRKNSPDILENETWHEGNLGVGSTSIAFPVADVYANKPARAFVKLQDYSSNIDVNAHNLALSINSQPTKYDSGYTNKYQVKTLAAVFPSSALVNGTNYVNIHSYPTQNTINAVIRDWYELEYPRFLQANTNGVTFSYRAPLTPSLSAFQITGVTSAPSSLYRFIWKDSSVLKITNFKRVNGTVVFDDTLASGRTYFFAGEATIKKPFVFYKRRFVNLRAASNQADYIAITHPYFKTAASSYLAFVSATYGVTTKLVDVNDIYDEYNFGFYAAEPIRDFLQSTHLYWQAPKPKFVFLIGRTTYDFYGNKTRNFGNPVTHNFVPSYGNPVSDVWFTLWDSTGSMIPQMTIGRIPAKNLDEFQWYFSKHQKYVTKGFDEWNKRYIFFAGGNFTDPTQIAQSKGVNDFIINNYVIKSPIGGKSTSFYKTSNPVSNFGPYSPEYIKEAIDQGGVFISYIGHSGTQTWDNSITDVAQLSNIRDRNPLITDFGCSTGKFAEPDVFSFSELAVNDLRGQAIAYIGNTSLGFTTTAYSFPQLFYKKLLIDTLVSLGETHRLAKIDYIKQYGVSSVFGLFVLTNTLIGDPIVKLPIPPKVNLTLANTSIAVTPSRPTEQTDTIHVGFSYNNFGKVTGDSLEIRITDEFNSKVVYSQIVKRTVPLFVDSIVIHIPIRLLPGEHTLSIHIDPSGKIDEMTRADNVLTSTIVVASGNTRNLTIAPLANQTSGVLTFLNPSVKSSESQFIVEVSSSPTFTPSQIQSIPFDTFYTKYRLDPGLSGKRFWIRTKNESQSAAGLTFSYVFGAADNYFIDDSLSFSRMKLTNSIVGSKGIVLDSTRIVFSAISAGFSDGRTVLATKNGQNLIPENTMRGHHVVLFDVVTYEKTGYFRFDVLAGVSEVNRYKAFLDTITSKSIVVIAVSDEGYSNVDASLKNSIKQLGSKYIDSLVFRGSWAIIGRKGAAPGSVPEKFSKPFEGRVQIDTTISIPNSRGTFETEPIGPVAAWKRAEIRYTTSAGSSVHVAIVGINAGNAVDTLKHLAANETIIDISAIDAQQYPEIKVAGEIGRAPGESSPSITSLAVNYVHLAELGTNYQTVRAYSFENEEQGREIAVGDTVLQGEKILLRYRIYNAGGAVAKNFKTTAAAVWDNNTSEPVVAGAIDSLPALSYKEFSGVYNTSFGYGRRSFRIAIDPDTLVRELYRDNNVFAFPVYVKKDSSKPLLPNLTILEKNVYPLVSPVTDERDSARFNIIYGNTGAFANDSVTISVRHFYKEVNVASWTLRRKYPIESDTLTVTLPILKRAGNHHIQVELDPVGLIVESAETDNVANYYFTVVTTNFKILQPTPLSASAFSSMIFLNPTNVSFAAIRIADLELDTLETFATARKLQLPMKEFTTSYDISQLTQGARYYWRIRRQQSTEEWTAGSFYLGASGTYAIGQADSSGWKSDAYVHTAYGFGGARVVNTVTKVKAVSAGYSDGRTGSIEVNGNNVLSPVFGTGHNLVVIDTSTYAVAARRRFDISNNADESDSLTQFIVSVAPGFIVTDVVVDEGSNNLKQSTRDALKTIGSASIDKLAYRDSWAIIGRKGAAVGSVPESYTPQSSGNAAAETDFVRIEYTGTITTPAFGPLSALSSFSMTGSIPAGTSVQTRFVGSRIGAPADTLVLTSGASLANTQIGNSGHYAEGKILFELQASGSASPLISSWTLSARQATELAVSEHTASIDRSLVMEGEPIHVNGRIFNVSAAPAESVAVQLSTNENGFEKVLKTQTFAAIAANDSAVFTYSYSTRGKTGNHAFVMKIDPLGTVVEQSKDNNTVTIPFTVQHDSLRPTLEVDIDGIRVVDGDFVSQHPVITLRYTDNNPTVITRDDSSNFKIRLNNYPVFFTPGIVEMITSAAPGAVQLKWTPELQDGENFMQIHAIDMSGNSSDTTLLFVNVSSKFLLADVYNLPNPFAGSTHFTFNVLGPVNPDGVSIKIFTVAGRLIQEIPYVCKIGFNKIFWDGRDKDGDEIANGVYFYKVIVTQGDKQTSAISKLVKMK